jgi:hypothetical protein
MNVNLTPKMHFIDEHQVICFYSLLFNLGTNGFTELNKLLFVVRSQ